ncbi:UNVERIFIED_CONTAM: hypothetical protein Sangu_3188400 [Sesamum angustifolium]|uniref:DUF4283 domain-containing protein n=1 Tax=Sesamum angustifolium TaxID=2727405 RepID=A0AAW2JMQ3_9LAMI
MDVNLPTPALEYQEQSAPPVIYVGNVKLQAGPVDNIAGAFLQSSRKTLHFVPPTRQNGEVIIRPTKEVVDNGSKKWHTTAVGYFLGRCWEQGMSLRRQQHTHVPVWIRLKHLPMEYWTEEGLSTVASGIGTPLFLMASPKLVLGLTMPGPVLRNGKEDPKRVDVEYEWLPQKCTTCCSLGHVEKFCPANSMKKTTAPPIKVFVKKRSVIPDTADTEQNTELAGVANSVSNSSGPSGLGKGKAIALYNSYGVLDTDSIEENDDQSPGPNQRSPAEGGS